MNDAGLMSRRECRGDLHGHIKRFAYGERRFPQALSHRLSINKFCRNEVT